MAKKAQKTKQEEIVTQVEEPVNFETNNEDNIDTPKVSSIEKIENEVVKKVEEVTSQVTTEINDIKAREEKILKEIETNPAAAQQILEKEIAQVDDLIKGFETKVEKLTNEVKKNKVVFTTNSWNGWGYGN